MERVAVCLSGWLNVSIPEAGALTRHHVVEPLKADVFVAGTVHPWECRSCLRARLHGLKPMKRFAVSLMLSHEKLSALMNHAPRFAEVVAAFNPTQTYLGLNVFAPLLGSSASVLREYHDYSRVIRLVEQEEHAVGANYTRIIFTRLEHAWLAPHPPLELLDPRLIWIPSTDGSSLHDRHAVVPRKFADVYFRRWELLRSPQLLEIIPLESLTHDGPEAVLENVLVAYGVPVGLFPHSWYLSCCTSVCWMSQSCVGMFELPLASDSYWAGGARRHTDAWASSWFELRDDEAAAGHAPASPAPGGVGRSFKNTSRARHTERRLPPTERPVIHAGGSTASVIAIVQFGSVGRL